MIVTTGFVLWFKGVHCDWDFRGTRVLLRYGLCCCESHLSTVVPPSVKLFDIFLLRFCCSSRKHQFHIRAKAYTLAVAIYAFLSNFFVGASFPPRILFASPLERRTFSKPGVCSLVGTERRADLGHAPRFTSISVHVTHFQPPSLSRYIYIYISQ